MEKLRCPNCGELTIPGLYNATTKSGGFDMFFFKSIDRFCPSCDKPYYVRRKYNSFLYWGLYLLADILISFAIALCVIIKAWPVMVILMAAGVWFSLLMYQNYGLVPVDKEDFRVIKPVSNVSLVLEDVHARTDNLDIYGIKFDKSTLNVRFSEAFERGLVPVMFLRKKRENTFPVDAYMYKTEFIPQELFFVGSTFSVYDNKYKIIAKGYIHKIYH